MTWTSPDNLRTLLLGDCLERLAELPAEHFHCCVTSPSYYCLRRKRKGKAPRRNRSTGERQLLLLED